MNPWQGIVSSSAFPAPRRSNARLSPVGSRDFIPCSDRARLRDERCRILWRVSAFATFGVVNRDRNPARNERGACPIRQNSRCFYADFVLISGRTPESLLLRGVGVVVMAAQT